jgi:hypothetical protein
MQPWRSTCIRSRLLGGTLGDDSTEHGTRYPVSHENCRKRIRLRRHLFRRSSTSEVPSFAALAVHAKSRLGRSRSVLRTVAAVEPAIPSLLGHGWGQVRLSRNLAPSSSTARNKECTRVGPRLECAFVHIHICGLSSASCPPLSCSSVTGYALFRHYRAEEVQSLS